MKEPRPPEWFELFEFWFHPPTPTDAMDRVKRWFIADAKFDAELKHYEPWLDRTLPSDWHETAEGALTVVLLYDQLPRNLYRGTAQAFQWDTKGLEEAKRAIAFGQDKKVDPIARIFFYLPFEHHESMEAQNEAVLLIGALVKELPPQAKKLSDMFYDFAVQHRDVIEKYGRFPHRNKALGRESTNAELAYLAQPGAGF